MCGIAGFTLFHQPVADAAGLIARMTDSLAHRGPDGYGHLVVPPIALGHRRLSIIDPEGGVQPMASPGGRHQLVFNGELYNYIELKQAREAQGETFSTRSDTEVLLHELMRDPVAALPRLNGIFAFAFWDGDKQELLLARDRFGIKPLYYAIRHGELIFASEVKTLLLHPWVSDELNRAALPSYFTFGHIPAPDSIYCDIHKLEPGHVLRFGPDGLREESAFWSLPARTPVPPQSLTTNAEELRERLGRAVRRQSRSDVPVGVLLSGGLDSSTLTALAARNTSSPLQTFSIGFEESSFDESSHAEAISRRFGTDHHHAVLRSHQAADLFQTAVGILDEPMGDPSFLPTFFLSHLTSQSVKVAFGGEGSDELFAGYPAFPAHFWMKHLSRLPATLQQGLAQLAARLPASESYANTASILNLFFSGRTLPMEACFLSWLGAGTPDRVNALWSPELRGELQTVDPFAVLEALVPAGADDIDRLQAVALQRYLQGGILTKVDRASMAHGLEVRVPFLDDEVVDFALTLPSRQKTGLCRTKRILKTAMRNDLPRSVRLRRKAGFMFPLAAWMRRDFLPRFRDLCSETRLARQGLFDASRIRMLLDEHLAGRQDHGRMLWSLMVFQQWIARHESKQP